MTKYLARLGHRVVVLTSDRSGAGPVEGAADVIRTPDMASTRLNWRLAPATKGGPQELPTGAARGIELHLVPDIALLSWLPFALPGVLRAARRFPIDCVITTAPPPSVHILGAALQRLGVRWIADLRDGWTVDPPRPPWRLGAERRLDEALERGLLRRADAVLGVTRPIVADLRERLAIDAQLVPNGFDPEETGHEDRRKVAGLLSDSRHSLVHTGRASVSERTPETLYAAIRSMLAADQSISGRLEVVFAGPLSAEEQRALADPELSRIVRAVGSLDHGAALALQREADSLLVIAGGPRERSLATGKLFEYLTTGLPILVIGEGSEAARIVGDTGTGFAVQAESPAAIAAGIERLMRGAGTTPDADAIARYSWERLAGQVGELVDELCARPAPRRRADRER
jgi:glycosyltransferase involved in cell wall biosynthesis